MSKSNNRISLPNADSHMIDYGTKFRNTYRLFERDLHTNIMIISDAGVYFNNADYISIPISIS